MSSGDGQPADAGDRLFHLRASPICGPEGTGARARCLGMCHPGLRQARGAPWHPQGERAGDGSRCGGELGEQQGSTVLGAGSGLTGAPADHEMCHPGLRQARGAPWHLSGGRARDGTDATGGRRAGEPLGRASVAACGAARPSPLCTAGGSSAACHPACRMPWHPEESRCPVPCAGPEDRARWARWRPVGSGARVGRALGSARAIRLAQTHTVCCSRCGDLVPLQKAREAARRAGRDGIAAADGCYGCGRHCRKARRAQRQSAMALAVLAGRRVLLETPATAGPRVELWMLPRAAAVERTRLVLARYQPQGLGRWLVHSCHYGA